MQRIFSIILYPLIALVAMFLKRLPKRPFHYYPLLDKLFIRIGLYPVIHHFYNPLVIPGKDFNEVQYDRVRDLRAIDLNPEGQLSFIKQLHYSGELIALNNLQGNTSYSYSFSNDTFAGMDGEAYYSLIRHFKPSKIMEVGSGHSTRIAMEAIATNRNETPSNNTGLICIEPFSNPWLEDIVPEVMRVKVEEVELSFFEQLKENDILFIDSSHVIRPDGDVLFEYLHLLPSLQKGVIIHIHDIFTPFHYPLEWVRERRMWNEQYLLEAFLSYNHHFKILLSVPYLFHFYREDVFKVFPITENQSSTIYGSSLWLQKIK